MSDDSFEAEFCTLSVATGGDAADRNWMPVHPPAAGTALAVRVGTRRGGATLYELSLKKLNIHGAGTQHT